MLKPLKSLKSAITAKKCANKQTDTQNGHGGLTFLAAQRSSRSLVVGPSARWLVRELCENVTVETVVTVVTVVIVVTVVTVGPFFLHLKNKTKNC